MDTLATQTLFEEAARLATLPEPIVVTIVWDAWSPGQDGWRVKLQVDHRIVSALLPVGEMSAERLALTLRLMAASDPTA
jgi:hypothetical protein